MRANVMTITGALFMGLGLMCFVLAMSAGKEIFLSVLYMIVMCFLLTAGAMLIVEGRE